MKLRYLFTSKKEVIKYAISLVCLLLVCLWGCGIYAIDIALKAPYDQHISDLDLVFWGDDEDGLLGYNIWYKVNEYEIYKRCFYNGEISTPTIIKTGKPKEEYIVSTKNLSPQDSEDSFSIICDKDPTKKFYFAVSSYGTEIAESGKVEFGRWPF